MVNLRQAFWPMIIQLLASPGLGKMLNLPFNRGGPIPFYAVGPDLSEKFFHFWQ